MALQRRTDLAAQLMTGSWGLERAHEVARRLARQRSGIKALVAAIFSEDRELRKRASDAARRVTEIDAVLLHPYADELAGALAELAPEESRTRWHMGLVVSRVAHTHDQRLRAGRLMQLLFEDESNVARCSAVEGMSVLACAEPQLRDLAMEIVERALRSGTPAMKCRARHAKRRLERAAKVRE